MLSMYVNYPCSQNIGKKAKSPVLVYPPQIYKTFRWSNILFRYSVHTADEKHKRLANFRSVIQTGICHMGVVGGELILCTHQYIISIHHYIIRIHKFIVHISGGLNSMAA